MGKTLIGDGEVCLAPNKPAPLASTRQSLSEGVGGEIGPGYEEWERSNRTEDRGPGADEPVPALYITRKKKVTWALGQGWTSARLPRVRPM